MPSISEALTELLLASLLTPYRELVNPGMLDWCIQNRVGAETFEPKNLELILAEAEMKLRRLLAEVKQKTDGEGEVDELAAEHQAGSADAVGSRQS